MPVPGSTLWLALVGIAALAVLAGFINDGLLSFRLETRHPSVIARFDSVSTPNSRQIARFVWTNAYRHLGDTRLTRLIMISRIAWVAAVISWTTVVVCVWLAD